MCQEQQYDVQGGQVAGPGLRSQWLKAGEGVAAQEKVLGVQVTAAEHGAWV